MSLPCNPASTNPANDRLEILSSHLRKLQIPAVANMTTPARPPITCHVLDTTTGRPAPNLAVKLLCCDLPTIIFDGTTNADGRIASWLNTQGPNGTEGAYVESRGGIQATLHSMIAECGSREGTASRT
jgi:5-hydroxyisourate hydrolase